MRFGMLHLFESPVGRTEADVIGEQLDLMQAAEDLGFDSIWPAEHHFSEYGYCVSTPLALAAVARATKRVRLGSAVVVLPFHNPIHVAEEFAFLDVLSGGRVDLGVGRGYAKLEWDGHGMDPAQSHSLFRESLEVIVQAWTQERVNYAGEHFTFEDLPVRPKPLQQPHPPIWVASLSPQSYELAGEVGANLLFSPTFTPDKQLILKALDKYRTVMRAHGHDPATKRIGALRFIYVADSMEQARKDFEGPVLDYYRSLSTIVAPKSGEALPTYELYPTLKKAAAKIDFDSLVEGGALIVGTPDYARERIQEFADETGVTDLLLWTRLAGLGPEKLTRCMELMSQEVFPAFREEPAAAVS